MTTVMNNEDSSEAPGFTVYVDDNFHFMDENSRWEKGPYSTYEEALKYCEYLVGINMEEMAEGGKKTGAEALGAYAMYGDDPWISPTPEGVPKFSARKYAKTLADAMDASVAS